jgi:ATP-dependent 26S proteasome regulatory subunit
MLHAQEEIKRIQSVPLVIGQFLEAVDQNTGIVGSTTGNKYHFIFQSSHGKSQESLTHTEDFELEVKDKIRTKSRDIHKEKGIHMKRSDLCLIILLLLSQNEKSCRVLGKKGISK